MSEGPGRKPTDTDDDILELFRESDDPVLSTREVADQLSISRRATYERLRKLSEEGKLEAKKIGGRSFVWWRPGYTETNTE